jgi:hypothetical protein
MHSLSLAEGWSELASVKGRGISIPAFFDPSGDTAMPICPKVPHAAVLALRSYATLPGCIGILPPNLDRILCWARVRGGGWRKCELGETQDRIESLRQCLMTNGLRIWEARCIAMDAWCRSPLAVSHMAALAEVRAQRKGQRARAAEVDSRSACQAPTRRNRFPPRSQGCKTLKPANYRAPFCDLEGDASIAAQLERECPTAPGSVPGRYSLSWY